MGDNETRIKRLDIYMKYKRLNDNQMTKICGFSKGLLSRARSGKVDIGIRTIEKILKKFNDINRDWLLFGEGDMLVAGSAAGVEGAVGVSAGADLFRLLEQKERALQTSQEQVNKLLSIVETLTGELADLKKTLVLRGAGATSAGAVL